MAALRSALRGDPVLWALGALAVAGIGVALLLAEAGFPIVSVDFRLLGPDAQAAAAQFLRQRGVDPDDYVQSVTFEIDAAARNYIERLEGLDTLNATGRSRSIWYWQVRFFQPLQAEEYSVRVDPSGPIVGFQRTLPEAEPGGEPAEAEARRTAEAMLQDFGFEPAELDPVSAAVERRPNRLDHTFVWEKPGAEIVDATYRVRVTVQGVDAGGLTQFFKIPEDWRREQAQEFNRGVVLFGLGRTATVALLFATGALFIVGFQRGLIAWRFSLPAAALLALVALFAGLNALPLLLADFPTTQSLLGYLTPAVLGAIGGGLVAGLGIVVAGVVGVWLYRRALPHLPSPESYGRLGGLATRGVAKAVTAGYLLTGLWLGYVALFYAAGVNYLGFWNPPEVPYRDIMSTFAPIAFPITAGASAAIGEEFLFRMLAVPLVLLTGRRLFRGMRYGNALSLGLALLLPAVMWGSLHATWPQQPFYIRAIEVSIAGIASAAILLRYGILATLVNHYVSNAAVVGALFLLSGNASLQAPAAVAVALPLLLFGPAAVAAVRGRLPARNSEPGAAAGSPASVDPEPDPAPPAFEAPMAADKGIHRLAWLGLAVAAAVSIVVLVTASVPRQGSFLAVQVDEQQARRIARDVLQERGLDPDAYTEVVRFADRSLDDDTAYLLQRFGTGETNRLLDQEIDHYLWEIRYVRELSKDSAYVWVTPDEGKAAIFFRSLEEAAPGADLEPAQAQLAAERGFAEFSEGPPGQFSLVDSSSEKQPNRTDHRFVWERIGIDLDGATLRASVTVSGSEPTAYFPFVKIPEQYVRSRAELTPAELAWNLVRGAGAIAIVVAGGWYGLGLLRGGRVRLRFPLAVAGGYAALWLVVQITTAPALLSDYNSNMGFAGFLVWRWSGSFQAMLLAAGQLALAAAVANGLFAQTVGAGVGLGRHALDALKRRSSWSLPAALLTVPAIAAAAAIFAVLSDRFARDGLTPHHVEALDQLGTFLPAVNAPATALQQALWWTVLGSAAILVLLRLFRGRRTWLIVAVGIGALIVLVGGYESPGQFALDAGRALALAAIGGLALRYLLGWSPLAAGYLLFATLLLRDAGFWLGQPDQAMRVTGVALVAIALAPAAAQFAVTVWRGRRPLAA